jgi:glutaredoxin
MEDMKMEEMNTEEVKEEVKAEEKKTADKVKELLEGHCYGPLREAAEKWLAVADDKFDVKEKAGKAWDKLNDAADSFADASEKFNKKMNEAGEKVTEGAEKIGPAIDDLKEKATPVIGELKEKAAPAVDSIKAKAAPVIDDLKEKAAPAVDTIKSKAAESELIAQLKDGICTLSEVIETFSKPEMKDRVGEEAAEQIRSHAEALKAEGKKYCDCPACTKARAILKDLGIELEDVVAEPEEAAEAEETEPAEAE